MRRLILVLVAVTSLPGEAGNSGPCKSWEFRCNNDQCVSPNRFCDGTDDCGDSSDEFTGCTNCNQTLMGEVGTKYPLRITEPFQRNLPFVCKLHLVAGGGNAMGERLEITFLSFQIGSLMLDRNGSEDRLECRRGYLRLSESQDDFFLGDDGSRISGSTLRSQQTRGFSQLISAFKEPPTRQLSTLYDLTGNMEPDFGRFCGSLISSNLGVAFYSTGNNVTLSVYLPPRSSVGTTSMMGSFGLYLTYRFISPTPAKGYINGDKEPAAHLGNPVANTYCDRTYVNCDRKKCLIQSPNFPGLYLRNFTCNYFIRQDYIPPGKRAHIIVSQQNEYKISVNTGSSLMRSDPRKALSQGSSGLTTDCSGDAVRIFDRINSETKEGQLLLTEFCESGCLTDVVSSGPEMLVQLYSAPSNLLYESRLELEIRVDFEDTSAENGEFRLDKNSKCEIFVDGLSNKSGVIRSPRHSVPKNTTCTAYFKGTRTQKIWLYFVSYFVQDHETLGFDHHPSSTEFQHNPAFEDSCDISSLDLYLDMQRNTSIQKLKKQKNFAGNSTLRFCEKTLPLMCTRAADYENHVPKKPCLPPDESYLSFGSEIMIKYSLYMRSSDVVSSLSATSFLIRYEFIETELFTDSDKVESYGSKICGQNFSAAEMLNGIIYSPKNVFFYGRGGKETLKCEYHFTLRPKERIIIEVLNFHSELKSCTTFFDPLLRKFSCRFNGENLSRSLFNNMLAPERHSILTFAETFASMSIFAGCICSSPASSSTSYIFASSSFDHSSSATLRFHLSGMTAFEDFNDFQFKVRFRITSSNSTNSECSVLPDALERNRTHGGELTFQASPSRYGEPLLRCQWFLQSSSTDAYLYLQLRGRLCDGQYELDELNKVILYSSVGNGLMYPKLVLCLATTAESSTKPGSEMFDFFSSSWHNNDSYGQPSYKDDSGNSVGSQERNQSLADRVIVELMAVRRGTLTVRWLEVTKPSIRPQNGDVHPEEGRTMKKVNCLFECPELSACINPELWCDGIVHCPHSGYDESSENCQQTLTLYISVGMGCLAACIGIGLAVFFLIRRYSEHRHIQQQTHPTAFEHHPHCMQHNQNRELSSKHFQNASPVFIVGSSMKKKKKKNKDDFVRHLQAVEVRFPDIHM